MCGILGRVHRRANAWAELSKHDLAPLAHRGPDGRGVFSNEHIQFGHTRLSIIELTEAGRQPMVAQAGRYTITFNGEIYNYIELRQELIAKGVNFKSQTDTEVLLESYHEWGISCVDRFRGQFAFAIWDQKNQTVFLARDRCGEKPLFYHFTESCFSFASELKGLLPLLEHRPALNPSAVDMYLHYQYVPEPLTLLEGIHKLAAGNTLLLSIADWAVEPKRYWSVEQVQQVAPANMPLSDILNEVRTGLEDAVKMTLRSDVPVGIALSGGVDSSAIAVMAQKNYPEPMHAFSVGYPGRPAYDERQQARELAESLGMIVHEVELPVESFVDFFPTLVGIMDEPIADPAAFGHYSIPRAAAEQGIKVLLSGVGGDEVFWGYPYVTQAVLLNQFAVKHPSVGWLASWLNHPTTQAFLIKVAHYPRAHPLIRRSAETLQHLGDHRNPADQLLFYQLHPEFNAPFKLKAKIYGPAMQSLSPANPFIPMAIGRREHDKIPAAIIHLLFETWLVSNCLSLGDRVSMGAGVETRMPFLDVRLIERVMSLRANNPDHQLGQKVWLRLALKGIVPDEVLTRPKAGFQPPVREWLLGVVEKYSSILKYGQLVQSGILAAGKIEYICSELLHTNYAGLFLAYKLVLLEFWYQEVVVA